NPCKRRLLVQSLQLAMGNLEAEPQHHHGTSRGRSPRATTVLYRVALIRIVDAKPYRNVHRKKLRITADRGSDRVRFPHTGRRQVRSLSHGAVAVGRPPTG